MISDKNHQIENKSNNRPNRWFTEHFWMPLLVAIISGICVSFLTKCNDEHPPTPGGTDVTHEQSPTSESDDSNAINNDNEVENSNVNYNISSTTSNESNNAPKHRIIYDTSNYLGDTESFPVFAFSEELVTITVDVCSFSSISIADEYGNPIVPSPPLVNSGSTIPFSFIMPTSDIFVTITS